MAIHPLLARLIPLGLLVGLALGLRVADLGVRSPGVCRVWFLDVGQGDAELVETPEGKRVLVDGGPDRSILAKLGEILPPWDRRLDAALLSHPDADHVTGLAAVLDRYQVGVVYESGVRGKSGAARAMAKDPVKHQDVRAGDRLAIGGATFEILAPADAVPGSVPDAANAFSVVAKLSCGGGTILLTGDLPGARERLLAGEDVSVDVLKVAHHGSVSSSDPAFLDAVHPSVAVIEVGEKNTFGHPHPAILERLNTRGIQTWRTDVHGDVLFEAGNGAWNVRPRPLPF